MTGSELRDLRRGAGWRANKLAEALDISVATFSKYENGHAPIPKKVELAARYLCEHPSTTKPANERLVDAIKEIVNG